MTRKYIDAELLRKEIERLKTENNNIRCTANGPYCVGYDDAFGDLLSTINSLQQEQPEVDLGADIEMEWDSFNKHLAEYGDESDEVVWLNWTSFVDVAHHFYKLGCRHTAEKTKIKR